MTTLNTLGILISKIPYRETGSISRVLSKDYGKIAFITRKGTSNSKKGNFTRLDIFDYGNFTFTAKESSEYSDLKNLSDFQSSESFQNIRSNLDSFVIANVFAESLDLLFTHEYKISDHFFEFLVDIFKGFNEATDVRTYLKTIYFGLSETLAFCGIYSTEDLAPASANNLMKLLSEVEASANRGLRSKGSLIEVLERMRGGKD